VRGKLVVREPAGARHGLVAMSLGADALDGEDLLPGFSWPLASVL